jgi:hypothetical protein
VCDGGRERSIHKCIFLLHLFFFFFFFIIQLVCPSTKLVGHKSRIIYSSRPLSNEHDREREGARRGARARARERERERERERSRESLKSKKRALSKKTFARVINDRPLIFCFSCSRIRLKKKEKIND